MRIIKLDLEKKVIPPKHDPQVGDIYKFFSGGKDQYRIIFFGETKYHAIDLADFQTSDSGSSMKNLCCVRDGGFFARLEL